MSDSLDNPSVDIADEPKHPASPAFAHVNVESAVKRIDAEIIRMVSLLDKNRKGRK